MRDDRAVVPDLLFLAGAVPPAVEQKNPQDGDADEVRLGIGKEILQLQISRPDSFPSGRFFQNLLMPYTAFPRS